ncbi:hypothetical protein EBZ37_02635 [bacterium]|nr:hypothetical protein [bacterium]
MRVGQLDVEDPQAPQTLIEEAKKMSTLDLLINNAGIYPEDETPADFELGFRVNAIALRIKSREPCCLG